VVGQRSIKRFAEDDTIGAVARPRMPDGDDPSAGRPAGGLHIDAAPVVLAVRSALLVVDGDHCAVDDPQFAPAQTPDGHHRIT
jgi:hypothetical protein